MQFKIFSIKTGNIKAQFETLESHVNEWLVDHPNIVIEHTQELSQPNAGWSHLSIGVWYSEN
jgi:hypothetical protein